MAAIEEKMMTKEKQLEMEFAAKNRKMDQDKDIVSATLTQRALSEREKLASQREVAAMKIREKEEKDLIGEFNG
jgi:hypothetical protein